MIKKFWWYNISIEVYHLSPVRTEHKFWNIICEQGPSSGGWSHVFKSISKDLDDETHQIKNCNCSQIELLVI